VIDRAPVLTDETRAAVSKIARREGGYLAMFDNRLPGIDDLFSAQRSTIRDELERIRQGSAPVGTARDGAGCALGFVILAAGALAEPVGWPAVGAGAVIMAQQC
jgi:hypothetical protein